MIFICLALTILCITLTTISYRLYLNSEKAKKYISENIDSFNNSIDRMYNSAAISINEAIDNFSKELKAVKNNVDSAALKDDLKKHIEVSNFSINRLDKAAAERISELGEFINKLAKFHDIKFDYVKREYVKNVDKAKKTKGKK